MFHKSTSKSQKEIIMKRIIPSAPIVFCLIFLTSCASSIVNGEFTRTSNEKYSPKDQSAIIEIYMEGKVPDRKTKDIGMVTSRAWVLEKGMNELKRQARIIGADAVVNIKYDRKFSVDYLQDLYYLNGQAIVWE